MSELDTGKRSGSGMDGGGNAPLANGLQRECVFQVVRVSGTMRKVEEEAIRRARGEVVRVAKGGSSVLDDLFGAADAGVGVGGVESESEDDDGESDG